MSEVTSDIAPGGEESALDMASERDRGCLREAMKRWPGRWRGLDPEKKDGFVDGLHEANQVARRAMTSEDPEFALKAATAIASIVRTAVAMEGQVQADDHLQDKNKRMDDGKPTEVSGVAITVPPMPE